MKRKYACISAVLLLGIVGAAHAQQTVGDKMAEAQKAPAAPVAAVPFSEPLSAAPVASPSVRSDNLIRTIADLTVQTDILTSQEKYQDLLRKKTASDLKGQLDALELQEKIKNNGKEKSAEAGKASGTNAQYTPPPVSIVVRNIWSFGNKFVAEIFVGETKDVVSKGSNLITGDKVIDITDNSVVVQDKKGKRKTLGVLGSASL